MVFGKLMPSSNQSQENDPEQEPPSSPQPADVEDAEDGEYIDDSPQRVSALIGGSGVSLDGQSLIVPDGGNHPDDVSSINTSMYDFKGEMRILGTMNHDEEIPPSPAEELGKKTSQAQSHGRYEHKSGYPKEGDDKSVGTSDSEDGGCLPLWITDAPTWLKLVIVLSTALLVGAIVLIGVGAALAVQDDDPNKNTGNPGGPLPVPAPTNPMPTIPPVAPEPISPTAPASGSSPVTSPTTGTAPPTEFKTAVTTASPSAAPTSSTVSFFVTGGRFTGDTLEALPEQLPTLPNLDGNTVMFHLGDWNSPFATSCVESSYEANVELYQESGVPVYFVPGDNEFNDCPNPEQAFGFWYDYILEFETKYWPEPTMWNITRQEPNYSENFAYVHNGILFLGINLVGGVVHDAKEWQERHNADLKWIDDNYYLYEGQYDAMVILGHADPDIQANDEFFKTFYERVEDNYDTQVIFIHRNLGVESYGLEPEYNGISNLIVVVVEGSIWPPMLVQVDVKAGIVDIDQEEWYTDYMNGDTV